MQRVNLFPSLPPYPYPLPLTPTDSSSLRIHQPNIVLLLSLLSLLLFFTVIILPVLLKFVIIIFFIIPIILINVFSYQQFTLYTVLSKPDRYSQGQNWFIVSPTAKRM